MSKASFNCSQCEEVSTQCQSWIGIVSNSTNNKADIALSRYRMLISITCPRTEAKIRDYEHALDSALKIEQFRLQVSITTTNIASSFIACRTINFFKCGTMLCFFVWIIRRAIVLVIISAQRS